MILNDFFNYGLFFTIRHNTKLHIYNLKNWTRNISFKVVKLYLEEQISITILIKHLTFSKRNILSVLHFNDIAHSTKTLLIYVNAYTK